jgi:deazaflavin-dependent oxidoreductase (nitroreductase family)
MLTTIGRRSGQPRTVMLTAPVRDGETLVIVASRGGDDHHPSWYLNLLDHPQVTVAIGGAPARSMRATEASPAQRAALWPQVVEAYHGYSGYQDNTDRLIPLVLLEPVDGTST